MRDMPSAAKSGSLFLSSIPSKYDQRFERQHPKPRCPSAGQAKNLEHVSLGIRKVDSKSDRLNSFGRELG